MVIMIIIINITIIIKIIIIMLINNIISISIAVCTRTMPLLHDFQLHAVHNHHRFFWPLMSSSQRTALSRTSSEDLGFDAAMAKASAWLTT